MEGYVWQQGAHQSSACACGCHVIRLEEWLEDDVNFYIVLELVQVQPP